MSLLIDQAGVGDLLGLGDAAQSPGIRIELIEVDPQRLAAIRSQVGEYPEVGFTLGQLDLELADGPAFERELHPLLRRAGADRQVKVTMCDGQLAVGGARLPGLVTLDDLVNVDVAPTPGAPIDDLEYHLLPRNSRMANVCQRSRSEPPGSRFGPVAERTVLPSIIKLMHVSPG